MAYDEDLGDRVRVATQHVDVLTEKRMFGGLAFLVNGNMAVAASSHGGLMLRVDPERTASLLAAPGTAPMVMSGRETRGWLRVEEAAVASDEALRHWVDLAVAYAAALPPK